MAPTTVSVALPGAAYDVVIGEGLLETLPDLLARHCPAVHYAVVTDSNVGPLYGERVRAAAATHGAATLVTFAAGESHKSRDTWADVTDRLLAAGIGRDGAVIALGGGVVGDLAGFVAATYLRGVPCVQIPTTLLAMIDSSVGGKTGVDTGAGKNLVGAFHQPKLVAADVSTLRTLPAREVRAGMAEALKHGAIASRSYFDALLAGRESILAGDPAALAPVVTGSVRIKAAVVAEDEKESGRRATLNFGHTIGHAVEAAMDYSLLHGEAIAIGMALEALLGASAGVTRERDARELIEALEAYGLPTRLPKHVQAARLLALMQSDKKARAGSIRFSLIAEIGTPTRGQAGEWTLPIERQLVEAVLAQAS